VLNRVLAAALAAVALAAIVAGAAASVTSSDGAGTVVLNGAKVFPIVLAKGPDQGSTAPDGADALAKVAAAGVTLLKVGPATTPWTPADITDANSMDRAAATHGLGTWINLSTVAQATPASSSDSLLQQVIGSLKSDAGAGAVAMWKGADEPLWSGIAPSALQFAYCRSTSRGEANWCGGEPVLDADHSWVTVEAPRGTAQQIQPYGAITDIHGVDVYPVTLQATAPDLHEVGRWTSTLASVTPSHAVWTTLQVCASGSYDTSGHFVLPTLAQERYMAYDAIINGARSLAFYGGNIPGCWSSTDRQYGWNWAFWDAVLAPLLGELNASSPLAPALVDPASTTSLQTNDSSTAAISRSGAGTDLWVIAARNGPGTARVTISGLPSNVATGSVYTEGRTIPVTNGTFTDDFAQWGVHIYRFTPAPSPPPAPAPPAPPSGGSGGGSVPNLGVSMSATTSSLQPTGADEITVNVQNTGGAGSLQTHLIVKLPDSLTLLGPPYYERGSGCSGTSTIDCFLDFIPNGAGTPVRFAVRADAPGPATVTATASSDRDSDSSDNTAALTLTVVTPAAPPVPPAPAPTVSRAPHTRSGSAHADWLTGTAADDLLYGLAGNDVLLGGRGNDILYGGRGNDVLNGGAGRDRLYGGPGNDILRARDGQRDVVDCGPGRDTAIVDRLDHASGCEIVRHT
jgi:hypothetical protein